MRERFYKYLSICSAVFGSGFFLLVARCIAGGYFVLFPSRRSVSVRFYRVLFPGRRRLYHYWCAWRQFSSFTSVFLDRHLLQHDKSVSYTFEGRRHLLEMMKANRGGILLMTHLGNWEVGARLLRQSIPDLRLMLYVGQRAKDQIERLQKRDLAAEGITVLAVDQEEGSAFDLVEGITFLRSGGFVSMAGDMIWRPNQRAVTARFLGRHVQLPEAPHMMALVADVPLFVFFALSTGRQSYHFSLSPPIFVKAENRAERSEAIRRSVQAYADQVEQHVRRSPFEWYHFDPFLGDVADPTKKL